MRLNRGDVAWLLPVIGVTIWAWLQDGTWREAWDTSIVCGLMLPVGYWLGRPWKLCSQSGGPAIGTWMGASGLLMLGAAFGINLCGALAASLLLWGWLKPRLETEDRQRVRRLLVLFVLSFPWVVNDARWLGWWFRISGAAMAEGVLSITGWPVHREGVSLLVKGQPVEVGAACSGLNSLQMLMILGTVLMVWSACGERKFWWGVCALPGFAWVMNTSRIVAIAVTAVVCGPEFATGTYHDVESYVIAGLAIGVVYWLAGGGTILERNREARRLNCDAGGIPA